MVFMLHFLEASCTRRQPLVAYPKLQTDTTTAHCTAPQCACVQLTHLPMAPYPSPPPQQLHQPQVCKLVPRSQHHVHGNTRPDAASSSLRHGAPTDARGVRALIKALSASSAAAASEAAAVHAHAAKLGLDRERTARNGLIALYLSRGDRAAAGALFDGFQDGTRDVVSWTAMVTGHARLGFTDEAVALFFEMVGGDCGVAVDAVATAAGFAACAEAKDLALAKEAHRRVSAAKVALDVITWNALVDMYAKCGDVAAAHRCFRTMPADKTVVSWNTMISGFARAGEHGEALALFREMQREGVRPDDATFVAVLGPCAQLGALDTGRWVHAYMGRQLGRRKADGVVGNALLDMYSKCGAVDQAMAVFDGMARHDVYTYASMILGLATHGRAEDALALFATMRRAGVRPNAVTLLGVLSACCHAGRVEEGLRHLNDMARSYDVTPGIEHSAAPSTCSAAQGGWTRRRHSLRRCPCSPTCSSRAPPRGMPGTRRRRASRAGDAVHGRRRLRGLRSHVEHVRVQGTAPKGGAVEEAYEGEQYEQGPRV